ncbi:MAG: hypothetical protein HYV52_02720 [Parcubacteria group bacterium]|nr:hypothetical protein [Parcubacteria group bacterium]
MKKIIASLTALIWMFTGVIPALAVSDTDTLTTDQQTCMQTAVTKREDALMTSYDVWTAAVKTARTTLKTDLVAAWGKSTVGEVKTARKDAWKKWRDSRKSATQILSVSRKSAWNTFKTDNGACKPPATGKADSAGDDVKAN